MNNHKNLKKRLAEFIQKRKKLLIGIVVVIILLGAVNSYALKKSNSGPPKAMSVALDVGKNYEFVALDNQGKEVKDKIKFKIAKTEKTNQVLVQNQIFTAKNNKLFLIVNLELTNDSTTPLNILPGDLVRMSVDDDKTTKFAPDLHNNLVPVAAISTKLDRLGFVIPDNVNSYTLYIGEIDGKKEEINLVFPS